MILISRPDANILRKHMKDYSPLRWHYLFWTLFLDLKNENFSFNIEKAVLYYTYTEMGLFPSTMKTCDKIYLKTLNPILHLFIPNLFYTCSTSYYRFITRMLSLSYFHMKTAPPMITFSIWMKIVWKKHENIWAGFWKSSFE